MRLPASASRSGVSAWRARRAGAAATASTRAADTPQAAAAAPNQASVPSTPSGMGAVSGAAPRAISARAVLFTKGWASTDACLCQPAAARRPGATAGRTPGHAQFVEQAHELVLDDVGERADHQQPRRVVPRHLRHQRHQAVVLALSQAGLDAAAGNSSARGFSRRTRGTAAARRWRGPARRLPRGRSRPGTGS